MKIVIAGGTGFIGMELAHFFVARRDEVVVLTRGKSKEDDGIHFVHWDGTNAGAWQNELNGAEALINLTGRSIDCRHNEKNKKEIIRSRVAATKILGETLQSMEQPPKVWINASGAGIYANSETTAMNEELYEEGDDFTADVSREWEGALFASTTPKTRKIALRISLVMGKSGGVYPVLRRLAKFGLAGKMGTGKQRFSWVHVKDVVGIVDFLIENESIEGPVNCTAPEVPTNKEIMKELRGSLNVSIGIPQPAFLLKIGGMIVGTESDLILGSRWVVPKRLLDNGFKFKFSNPRKALDDLA